MGAQDANVSVRRQTRELKVKMCLLVSKHGSLKCNGVHDPGHSQTCQRTLIVMDDLCGWPKLGLDVFDSLCMIQLNVINSNWYSVTRLWESICTTYICKLNSMWWHDSKHITRVCKHDSKFITVCLNSTQCDNASWLYVHGSCVYCDVIVLVQLENAKKQKQFPSFFWRVPDFLPKRMTWNWNEWSVGVGENGLKYW